MAQDVGLFNRRELDISEDGGMIRHLGEPDRAALMALLSAAPQFNLYLLGNVEANGFEQDFCEFWGDVVDGRVRGVVNRYMTGWTVYGEADAEWAALGAVVDGYDMAAERLQDNPGGVPSFLPYLKRYALASLTEDTLMELPRGGLLEQRPPDGFVVRRAGLDDLAGLVAFFANAGDMSRTPAAVERPLRDRRIWMALKGNEVVSAALTNAETSEMAMIGGVFTAPAWRDKGLSQAVCSALCTDLLASGRQPTLYWHYPPAGRVYTKLGFRPIGTWRSVRLVKV
jgi:predicted GNAT family acetyltransferase